MSVKDDARITGKIIYIGNLLLETPLLISAGDKGNAADEVLLKDESGYPFIPATSIIGAMRHFMNYYGPIELKNNLVYEYFWGSPKGIDQNSKQSALYLRDLPMVHKDLDNYVIRIRDGVAIDNKYGIAADKKKFEYEVLEPGVSFQLYMEITLREAYNEKEHVKAQVEYLLRALSNGNIRLGAKTTRGLGKCRLTAIQYMDLDFNNENEVFKWLNKDQDYQVWVPPPTDFKNDYIKYNFSIKAEFAIKHSILVRSYSGNPEEPDTVHISRGGKPVLAGTSLAGAIRARAEKIANTFMVNNSSNILIRPLFGWADEQLKDGVKYKSRLLIEETLIDPDVIAREKQTRIKIDRFTGGALKKHLFEELPLWPREETNDDTKVVCIDLSIRNCEDYEAGLLLLILKDLWDGDLAIGGGKNIGRGILRGIEAEIFLNDEVIRIDYLECDTLEKNQCFQRRLMVQNKQTGNSAYHLLQQKVDAFHAYCKQSKEMISGDQ